jgi:hypothetical protein
VNKRGSAEGGMASWPLERRPTSAADQSRDGAAGYCTVAPGIPISVAHGITKVPLRSVTVSGEWTISSCHSSERCEVTATERHAAELAAWRGLRCAVRSGRHLECYPQRAHITVSSLILVTPRSRMPARSLGSRSCNECARLSTVF